MPAGTFTLYNSASLFGGNGTINYATHSFRLMLLTSAYVPNAETHSTRANVAGSEITGANGYTTNGGLLTGVAWTRVAATAKFASNNFVWTATGGPITARYGVVYSDTATNDELVGYFLLDGLNVDLTATAGNTFTAGPDPTNGWFRHTVNV